MATASDWRSSSASSMDTGVPFGSRVWWPSARPSRFSSPPPNRSQRRRPQRPCSIMKRRVLIVEDDVSLSRVIEATLAAEGFEVRTVSDGDEAIGAEHEFGPDL